MGLYARHILPLAIHLTCGAGQIRRQRALIVPEATGRVLEVGIGSGHNLAFYDRGRVARLIGLDPSPELTAMARRAARRRGAAVDLVEGSAEAIPLATASIDTVVTTFTLCSVTSAAGALDEMRRVLRPDGRLLFCEHGMAPDAGVRRWQERIEPWWARLAGGCRLTRPVAELIEQGGFRLERLDTLYLSGPPTHTFIYRGAARPD
jgi:ubiquinone/menaquinone biosynthesis C-methylase UbiE